MNLSKAYQPGEYEANIYALWETAGAFRLNHKGEPFSIVMPPPNANGNLHVGHALTVAIEDCLTRYQRMQGRDAVWIPGADHAGFETWTVFEKALSQSGKSRFDFSRDQLYQMTWDFVAENRGNMELQLRALGASCDWEKMVFTLDQKVVDIVYETFKKMWDDGLVYRGKKLVNYCTKHQTSFADIEVDYEDRKTPLYYMKYGPFELATTRPETKFGDTAVAVNPKDDRYQKYVGQIIEVEGVNGPFKVKVIADEHVDMEFGTGVVKVTPAHDFNDWEMSQRHNLPAVQVIDRNGRMTDVAGRYAGMTVLEARKAVVKALKEKGLLIKIDENYQNRVGTCYKCGTTIEPMLMDQWFINVKPLTEKAIKVIKSGRIKFTPKQKGEELIRYYQELKDWNISRQIPWGIPIPAFKRFDDSREEEWIFDTRVDQEFIEVDGVTYKRDEDTFDTWLSSGQWPYITTRGDLERFYPTSVMETGFDILRPWVARMIMLGLYISDDIPFRDVYLHGLVLDEHSQKMSKSKGNVVNPMDMLGGYGSDALRMGLIANRSAGISQAFSPATVVAGRNFCNKLWNIARYIESVTPDEIGDESQGIDPDSLSVADHWILRQFDVARDQIEKLMAEFRFSEAYEILYHTIWDDFADWFIESSKIWNDEKYVDELAAVQNKRAAASFETPLRFLLKYAIKLAHPFAPFVTETIWQSLYKDDKSTTLLMTQQWPEKLEYDELSAAKFDRIMELVGELRYLTKELGGGKRTLYYFDDELIAENAEIIKFLARLDDVTTAGSAQGMRVASYSGELWISADPREIEKYHSELTIRLESTEIQITNLEERLNNKSYVDNAPADLVAESREELADKQALVERLSNELKSV